MAGDSDVDYFYLRRIFPDAHAFLNAQTPRPSKLSESCVYALDANALITLYKLGTQGASPIGDVLRKLAKEDRMFVPERALQECLKNRAEAISATMAAFHKQGSENHPAAVPEVPMLEEMAEYRAAKSQANDIGNKRKSFRDSIDKMKASLRDWGWNDPISKLFCEVFIPARIVKCTMKDEDVVSDLNWRFKMRIPPGFKDGAKVDAGIGDVLIWHSLIQIGKSKNVDVIFVSNDEKTDWMHRGNDEALITRSELTAEFFASTGKHFAVINLSRFLELNHVSGETVEAVKTVEHTTIVQHKHTIQEESIGRLVHRLARALKSFGRYAHTPAEGIENLKKHHVLQLITRYYELREFEKRHTFNILESKWQPLDPLLREIENQMHLLMADVERLRASNPHYRLLLQSCKQFISLAGS